jgi:hypothetical protein
LTLHENRHKAVVGRDSGIAFRAVTPGGCGPLFRVDAGFSVVPGSRSSARRRCTTPPGIHIEAVMSEINNFRKHLQAQGKSANIKSSILSQALAAARRRRHQQWLDANRPEPGRYAMLGPQAKVDPAGPVLLYSLNDTPMSTPPEGASHLVEQIVLEHAREHPGQPMALGAIRCALEDEGVLGLDVCQAAIHQAHAEGRVALLGKNGKPESAYPCP